MYDRADVGAALLTGIGFTGALVIALLDPAALGGGLPGLGVFLVLTVPTFSYATYWALSIRRALAVPLYRRQAFGIASITLAMWFTIGVFIVVPSTWPLVAYTVLTNYTFYFLFITLFYWIDASILASRRSDPLLRDTLYWSKIRIPLWITNMVIWGVPVALIGYAAIVGDASLMNILSSGTFPNTAAYQILRVIYNLVVLVLICGIVYLPAIAIRAKYNLSLRRHFIWFVPTAVGLLLLFFGVLGSLGVPGQLASALIFVFMGYSLYRSARALVPVNRVSHHEED